MILLIDNYDSFVYNLARYLQQLGQETVVVRSDSLTTEQVQKLAPDAILISPGPGTPQDAGCSVEVVTRFHRSLPILGICLGHQAIATAFGGKVFRTGHPVHGKSSEIHHDGKGEYFELPNPLVACRYHSLAVDPGSLPSALKITARTSDEVIMGIRHETLPIVGMQFHPESILTKCGYELLAGFLRLGGIASDHLLADRPCELRLDHRPQPPIPETPVSF